MNLAKRLLFSFTTITIVAFMGLSLSSKIIQKSLPVLGSVPSFILYDTNAKEFSSNELKGKVFVTDFIFTTCAGICPMMSQNMSAVYRSFISELDVHFVSISVNPEYDSPDILAAYAKRYHADIKKWHFLTGSREAITRLTTEGFKLGSVDEPAMHSGYFVLADRQSRIRGFYDGTKPEEIRKLLSDVARLLRERSL